MPVVGIPVEMLSARLGDPRLETAELVANLKRLGCDVEGYERIARWRCARCGTFVEADAAGEVPALCDGCGAELREGAPGAAEPAGELDVVKIDLLPVRPDMLDPGGLARALRSFLGRGGPGAVVAEPPTLSVTVDAGMAKRGGAFRPYIACAALRDVRLDAEVIPVVMRLQENLHWAMCRDRKLASIGIYDLSTVRGRALRFRPVGPEEMRFVPLMCDPDDPGSSMTPREVLERHPKGVAYAHLLAGHAAYPLLEDEEGGVLSMPPIINSEATKVHAGTTELFVDVTGLSERLVHKALAVTVTSLAELLPEARLEQVRIVSPAGEVDTPDLAPEPMRLDAEGACRLIGAELDRGRVADLLRRMGHDVEDAGSGDLRVLVPAYRNDVMHEVDLVEDVAMGLGYDEIRPCLVPTMTVGQALPVEELSAVARQCLTGLGLLEMVTLPLTSPEAAFDALDLRRSEDFVAIANPASVEQTMVRTSLLPGLLEALRSNIHRELPHRVFEVGDASRLEPESETGAVERRLAAVALVGVRVGLADAWSVADALLADLGHELRIDPGDLVGEGLWIPGRGTRIRAKVNGEERVVGVMGEVHPAVLERFGLRAPAALLEVELELLGDAAREVKTG